MENEPPVFESMGLRVTLWDRFFDEFIYPSNYQKLDFELFKNKQSKLFLKMDWLESNVSRIRETEKNIYIPLNDDNMQVVVDSVLARLDWQQEFMVAEYVDKGEIYPGGLKVGIMAVGANSEWSFVIAYNQREKLYKDLNSTRMKVSRLFTMMTSMVVA